MCVCVCCVCLSVCLSVCLLVCPSVYIRPSVCICFRHCVCLSVSIRHLSCPVLSCPVLSCPVRPPARPPARPSVTRWNVFSVQEGKICHPQCSTDGCWGPGDENCLACAKYRFGKRCVESCDSLQGVYDAGSNTCKECDQECAVNCTGTVSDNTDSHSTPSCDILLGSLLLTDVRIIIVFILSITISTNV